MELSLAGLPLEDADLASLLQSFPSLRVLDLAGCQKLSPIAADVLLPSTTADSAKCHKAAAAASSAAIGSAAAAAASAEQTSAAGGTPCQQQRPAAGKLQVVDMQRCYQLEFAALSSVLAASQSSSLSAALLSHLTLDQWPVGGGPCTHTETAADSSAAADECALHHGAAAAPQQPAPTAAPPQLTITSAVYTGLRVLALHNCVMLTPAGLQVTFSSSQLVLCLDWECLDWGVWQSP